MPVSAKVIADSKFRDTRLITLEVEMHRFILPEFLTHRMISRNFQSSRAVPVEKMIEQVRNDPAMPVHWGKNQPGMVAKEELDGKTMKWAKGAWNQAAERAIIQAEYLHSIGTHKQIVNRLLEPFMWTKGVVTATEKAWDAFFKLRLHPDAQPEIYALAEKIKEAIDNSKSVELKAGQWHMPYVESYISRAVQHFVKSEQQIDYSEHVYQTYYSTDEAIKVSASCNAQVSYRKLDDSLEKAEKIYAMLNLPEDGVYPDDPPHFSPTEHIAKACDTALIMSGNFQCNDFTQYRKVLEFGMEKEVIK